MSAEIEHVALHPIRVLHLCADVDGLGLGIKIARRAGIAGYQSLTRGNFRAALEAQHSSFSESAKA